MSPAQQGAPGATMSQSLDLQQDVLTRRPTRRVRRMLFLPSRQSYTLAAICLVIVLTAAPLWQDESVWLGVGLALTLTVTGHGLLASRVVPWIPGVIAMVASLQWIVAAWAGYHVPQVSSMFVMAIPPAEYFSFAVPAVLSLTAGMFIALLREGRSRPVPKQIAVLETPLLRTLRMMVIGAITVRVIAMPVLPSSLQFATLLVSNFAFVGVFGMVLIRAPWWPLYAVVVLGVQAIYSSADGMFHELLLWMTYLAVIVAYTYRLRLRVLLAAGGVGFFLIFTLNSIKQEYRLAIGTQQLTLGARASLLGATLAHRLLNPDEVFTEEKLGLNVARTNQGWIISRALNYVPQGEPFAEGETVISAVRAALLPRVLDPFKYEAGSTEFVTRFTGIKLNESTSMGLSLAGEMYVNFGRSGGLLGVFVLGYLLGQLYRFFLRWSRESVLWWAWAPYVMLNTMQAESGLGEAFNHVVKSSIVMFAAIAVIPAWSMLRRWRPQARRASALRR